MRYSRSCFGWHLMVLAMVGALTCGGALAQKKPAKAVAKKLYCWEVQGQRVCGDALPAEAAGAARQEISARTGMTTAEIGRQLTPEEVQAKAQADAQAALAAQQLQSQANAARALRTSFANEQALVAAFAQRKLAADAAIVTAQKAVTPTRKALVGLLTRAADMELAGKKVPKKLAESVQAGHQQVLAAMTGVERARAARGALDTEQQQALALYRGAADTGAPDTAASGQQPQ